jgi:hypothetical protein
MLSANKNIFMLENDMKTQNCVCSKQGCWPDDEQKIPKYCQANKFLQEIEESKFYCRPLPGP